VLGSRGTVLDQVNEDLARQIGAAFARLVDDTAIVVRDMRPSSIPLAAFTEGVASQGHNVIDIGWAPPTCCTTRPAGWTCPAP
jgi:phosphomannomutase